MSNPVKMVAKFPTVDCARRFFDRLGEGRDRATDVTIKGRAVAFTADLLIGHDWTASDSLASWREIVGYYGSSSARKATLNGHTCPVGY